MCDVWLTVTVDDFDLTVVVAGFTVVDVVVDFTVVVGLAEPPGTGGFTVFVVLERTVVVAVFGFPEITVVVFRVLVVSKVLVGCKVLVVSWVLEFTRVVICFLLACSMHSFNLLQNETKECQ